MMQQMDYQECSSISMTSEEQNGYELSTRAPFQASQQQQKFRVFFTSRTHSQLSQVRKNEKMCKWLFFCVFAPSLTLSLQPFILQVERVSVYVLNVLYRLVDERDNM